MYRVAYKTRRGGHTIVNLTTLEEVRVKLMALYKSRTAAKVWVDDKTQPTGRAMVGEVWKCAERGWLWYHETDEQQAL